VPVLAYVFWHRPLHSDRREAYEQALIGFHRSLAHSPPVGTLASAAFRVAEAPLPPVPDGDGGDDEGPAYEDWYLVEDFAALGVLNEAAVGRGHHTSHDDVARRFGAGAGGLYALIEGEACAASLGETALAVWIARPPGSTRRALGELLGDGIDPAHASLWRRQLVLGPAPEFCVLGSEVPAGVTATRLPEGWSAVTAAREPLTHGSFSP
jgi:hypothetical protein